MATTIIQIDNYFSNSFFDNDFNEIFNLFKLNYNDSFGNISFNKENIISTIIKIKCNTIYENNISDIKDVLNKLNDLYNNEKSNFYKEYSEKLTNYSIEKKISKKLITVISYLTELGDLDTINYLKTKFIKKLCVYLLDKDNSNIYDLLKSSKKHPVIITNFESISDLESNYVDINYKENNHTKSSDQIFKSLDLLRINRSDYLSKKIKYIKENNILLSNSWKIKEDKVKPIIDLKDFNKLLLKIKLKSYSFILISITAKEILELGMNKKLILGGLYAFKDTRNNFNYSLISEPFSFNIKKNVIISLKDDNILDMKLPTNLLTLSNASLIEERKENSMGKGAFSRSMRKPKLFILR